METNFTNLLTEIKQELAVYLDLKLKILQLEVQERTSITFSILLYVLILLFCLFFVVLFLFLALGFYLGELLHSNAIGMVVVSFLYVLTVFLFLTKRTLIQSLLVDFFLKELMKKEDKEECKDE